MKELVIDTLDGLAALLLALPPEQTPPDEFLTQARDTITRGGFLLYTDAETPAPPPVDPWDAGGRDAFLAALAPLFMDMPLPEAEPSPLCRCPDCTRGRELSKGRTS